MNPKASFSAIIGVALVVLIASIGFTYYSSGVSQKAMLEQQDALELRQHWTNVRYLLDKAAAEALYDVSSSCSTIAAGYKSKLDNSTNGYFVSVLNSTNSLLACSFSNLNVSEQGNPKKFTVHFGFRCEKNNAVSYSMPVVMEKQLSNSGCSGGATCCVFDTQGNPAFQELP